MGSIRRADAAAMGLGSTLSALLAVAAGLKKGAGCEPDCMNSTLTAIATVANAPTANPTTSLAVHPRSWRRKTGGCASALRIRPSLRICAVRITGAQLFGKKHFSIGRKRHNVRANAISNWSERTHGFLARSVV
jgi:hypothetical protein